MPLESCSWLGEPRGERTDPFWLTGAKEPMYTFWDYMRNRWERDGGLRLDHVLLSSALTARLQHAGVDRETRGMEAQAIMRPYGLNFGMGQSFPSRRFDVPAARRQS